MFYLLEGAFVDVAQPQHVALLPWQAGDEGFELCLFVTPLQLQFGVVGSAPVEVFGQRFFRMVTLGLHQVEAEVAYDGHAVGGGVGADVQIVALVPELQVGFLYDVFCVFGIP